MLLHLEEVMLFYYEYPRRWTGTCLRQQDKTGRYYSTNTWCPLPTFFVTSWKRNYTTTNILVFLQVHMQFWITLWLYYNHLPLKLGVWGKGGRTDVTVLKENPPSSCSFHLTCSSLASREIRIFCRKLRASHGTTSCTISCRILPLSLLMFSEFSPIIVSKRWLHFLSLTVYRVASFPLAFLPPSHVCCGLPFIPHNFFELPDNNIGLPSSFSRVHMRLKFSELRE
jgi:hypothetical protein